jgi:hypothetical protein
VIPPGSLDSILYRSTQTIWLILSPFTGSPTCALSRPLVLPRPSGSDFSSLLSRFRHCRGLWFLRSVFHPSTFLASLGSTGITPLLRYYEGSVTSRAQFFGPSTDHERCSLSRFVIPDSYRSNFRPFYLQPPYAFLSAAHCAPEIGRGFTVFPSRDGFRSWLRHTRAGSPMHLGRIEFNIVLFTDWSFASGCSPPFLWSTQLPSATDRPVLLSDRDFHPTVGAYFQAHSCCPSGTKTIRPSKRLAKLS